MKQITAQAEEFKRQAEQFAAMGRQLTVARDLLVGSIRDFGLLKDVVEGMVATIRFTVTMPEPDLADAGSAQPDANDGRAFADPSKAA
jgi:hypothetical protein